MHKHFDEHEDHAKISPARLEAFSDGVLAIIITITVLGFKIPTGNTLSDLLPLLPFFLAYAVSFQTVGTYWNNHHHLLQVTKHISAGMMWANLNLLFWLSFIPFGAGWLGESSGGAWPTAFYSFILLMCGFSYSLLQASVLLHSENRDGLLAEFSKSRKGTISLVCYALAVVAAFFHPVISDLLILVVAVIWFIPDKRIEKFIS